jgi:hypothetical protein
MFSSNSSPPASYFETGALLLTLPSDVAGNLGIGRPGWLAHQAADPPRNSVRAVPQLSGERVQLQRGLTSFDKFEEAIPEVSRCVT